MNAMTTAKTLAHTTTRTLAVLFGLSLVLIAATPQEAAAQRRGRTVETTRTVEEGRRGRSRSTTTTTTRDGRRGRATTTTTTTTRGRGHRGHDRHVVHTTPRRTHVVHHDTTPRRGRVVHHTPRRTHVVHHTHHTPRHTTVVHHHTRPRRNRVHSHSWVRADGIRVMQTRETHHHHSRYETTTTTTEYLRRGRRRVSVDILLFGGGIEHTVTLYGRRGRVISRRSWIEHPRHHHVGHTTTTRTVYR